MRLIGSHKDGSVVVPEALRPYMHGLEPWGPRDTLRRARASKPSNTLKGCFRAGFTGRYEEVVVTVPAVVGTYTFSFSFTITAGVVPITVVTNGVFNVTF